MTPRTTGTLLLFYAGAAAVIACGLCLAVAVWGGPNKYAQGYLIEYQRPALLGGIAAFSLVAVVMAASVRRNFEKIGDSITTQFGAEAGKAVLRIYLAAFFGFVSLQLIIALDAWRLTFKAWSG